MLAVGVGNLTLSVGGSGWTAANVGSLLSASGGGFASGSVLGIDTTAAGAGFSYGAIAGNMGLTKLGPNSLTPLTAVNTFAGSTTVSGGTLNLVKAALCRETKSLSQPLAAFPSLRVSARLVHFWGPERRGEHHSTKHRRRGPDYRRQQREHDLRRRAQWLGLADEDRNWHARAHGVQQFLGGITVVVARLTVASSGALIAASGKNLYVGYSGPAAMTIQEAPKSVSAVSWTSIIKRAERPAPPC